jgi:competence protein ComFC
MLRRAGDALLSLFFPPHCASCGADTPGGVHVCEKCLEGARQIEAPFCRQCSQPFEGEITGSFSCSNCGDRRFHFDCAVAPYLSREVVRDFIHKFKYERQYHLRHQLATWAAAGLDDERIRARPFDAFVPVPLHPTRKREREFNQAEVIARLLSHRAGVPVRNAIERIRYTTTQTRLDRHERMENLRGAFRVRHPALVQDRHFILVDDVFTTGSTVEECARVLRGAGAASVRALTVARG